MIFPSYFSLLTLIPSLLIPKCRLAGMLLVMEMSKD